MSGFIDCGAPLGELGVDAAGGVLAAAVSWARAASMLARSASAAAPGGCAAGVVASAGGGGDASVWGGGVSSGGAGGDCAKARREPKPTSNVNRTHGDGRGPRRVAPSLKG